MKSGPTSEEGLTTGRISRPRGRAAPISFIKQNLALLPVPSLPEIRLYTAHPASGLWRLKGSDSPPYWAYHWAGGAVLARYILDRPETVAGKRVLDLGAGSGLVGIAAAKAGAGEVTAADTDPYAIAALGLNAAANNVTLAALHGDPTTGPPPAVDIVAVGDLFYEEQLATRVTAFLDCCVAAGTAVLVGDPGREFLPRSRLRLVAEYRVGDFGVPDAATIDASAVFAFGPEAN